MTTLKANKLTLEEVEYLLKLEEQFGNSFRSLFTLEAISETEHQELVRIREEFRPYLRGKRALEGQVRLIVVAPLLRLAGFYQPSIELKVEEDISRIYIEDEDTIITGQFDIIAVRNNPPRSAALDFWILVIETKRCGVEVFEGLPQLLTYAHQSLEHQTIVWGLITNGMRYQFVYLQQGNPKTYQQMPLLNLFEPDSAVLLLQVLKAICRQNSGNLKD